MTLRAIALRRAMRPEATREARSLLEQALAIDPDYGPAWAALAYLNGMDIGLQLTGEWSRRRVPEALAQAERAIALGCEDADAYIALGLLRRLARQHASALAALQQAIIHAPCDVNCWHNLALTQYVCGQVEAALRSCERALDFNPLPSAFTLSHYAAALWGNRRLDETVRAAGDALAKHPGYWYANVYRMYALHELGRIDEARRDAATLLARLPRLSAAPDGRQAGRLRRRRCGRDARAHPRGGARVGDTGVTSLRSSCARHCASASSRQSAGRRLRGSAGQSRTSGSARFGNARSSFASIVTTRVSSFVASAMNSQS